MLASDHSLLATIYEIGHHGARSSCSASSLGAVRPQYVFVSAGAGNNYGHPFQEVLSMDVGVDTAVLLTNEIGTIEITADGLAL